MKNKRKRIENSTETQLAIMVASSSSFEITIPKRQKRNGEYTPVMKKKLPVELTDTINR